ncbi:MAG TPA: tripartite tricarboxylate transporter substrate binding protein [Pseudolabrys sp.]|jgi:tripartite-type tricarboxylate transporter receptor subunit TctC
MIKKFIIFAACILVSAVVAPTARAEWPDHPIRFIVGFGPGGANDLIARIAAAGVGKRLGQTVVIENRPGAGTAYVAHSPPDGYTFLVGAASTITNSLILKDLPYADSDLVPVGMIAVAPSTIVVNPSVPASNMTEFVAWAKAQGGKGITWATAGNGSTPEFVGQMIKEATGISLVIVPYKSGGDGVNGVLSNSVSATSEASIVVLPQIKAGMLKAIATTYEKRISAYPSITTTAEQGFPTVQIGHWAGLYAPRGTPEPIIQRMNAELQAALKTDEVKGKLTPNGIEPAGGSIADFVKFTTTERKRLSELAANMKKEK